ncbi:MAG TPA: right-handed parallel beta-helix repeat-containing protein [Anaerolineales bacterium]|nr:right-handed parallel beta-helix repeat-containing protein [Anaerolineales bacterium]HLO29336.1 right-handed parallel beta-helix repeat-containing protein [Anaerolineales bacterium]
MLALTNSTFLNNSAGNYGGGIFIYDQALITNNTFDQNTALQGGGIYFSPMSQGPLSTFSNNTIANSSGGGLYIDKGSLELFNNILADILTSADCYAGDTASLTGDHNLVEAGASLPNSCSPVSIAGDPHLDVLVSNGGSTQTIALLADSPAINAGNDVKCPAADQRGIKRPQGAHCDLGAFEYTDTTPPTMLGSERADADPTSAPLVNFTVTFSEAVSDVDAHDFALSTTGVTGATVTGVTGSDSIYTVTASIDRVIGAKGTIQLRVVDNDSIKDAFNNPLGGSGSGNGSFIGGESYTIIPTVLPPILSLPKNNAVTNIVMPVLTWNSVANAIRYEMEFATNSAFTENFASQLVSDPTFAFESPLPNGKFYWHVRAYNSLNQPGGWSLLRAFTIDTLRPPSPR